MTPTVTAVPRWISVQELDEARRLAGHRHRRPDARIGLGSLETFRGFVWEAVIPEPDGKRYVVRATLSELLDRLDVLLRDQ